MMRWGFINLLIKVKNYLDFCRYFSCLVQQV